MLPNIRAVNSCTWAIKNVSQRHLDLLIDLQRQRPFGYWSRLFEYPWALENLNLTSGDWVLDATGGDGALQHFMASRGVQIVNVDLDVSKQPLCKGVVSVRGDLEDLTCFQSKIFFGVACVSVLEHTSDPTAIVKELWRVVGVGRRLVLTFDVASYKRHNHSIDIEGAKEILSLFGKDIPDDSDALSYTFPEIDPMPHEPKEVLVRVLCVAATKGV